VPLSMERGGVAESANWELSKRVARTEVSMIVSHSLRLGEIVTLRGLLYNHHGRSKYA